MMPAIANPLPALPGFRRIWFTAMTPRHDSGDRPDTSHIIQPTSDEIREMTANVLVRTI